MQVKDMQAKDMQVKDMQVEGMQVRDMQVKDISQPYHHAIMPHYSQTSFLMSACRMSSLGS